MVLATSAAMAVSLFIVCVLAKYAGILKKAEKGFSYITVGAIFYLLQAAFELSWSMSVWGVATPSIAPATFGAYLALICSIVAWVFIFVGAVTSAQELIK